MDESGFEAASAAKVKSLRLAAGLSLEALSERSGGSRSMISLIERGESSPTARILDRMAAGLGVTLASLFTLPTGEAAPLARRPDQRAWTDPETGYVRRNLSPSGFASPLELVEIELPPGTLVTYDAAARLARVDQQIWILDGTVDLRIGDEAFVLGPGDCLAIRLDKPTSFANRTSAPARYLLALCTVGPD